MPFVAEESAKSGQNHRELPYLHLLHCPVCSTAVEKTQDHISCPACPRVFPIKDGIPLLFTPNDQNDDITDMVKLFYEENPFPNYEDTDDLAQFIRKAREGVFADLLDQQIPFGTRILECGCGTGQLSNFLGIAHRTVFGTDICVNSLGLAYQFKKSNSLDRVHFLQMNLFRPVFSPQSFDVVISNGVLHSTVDPYLGFQTLSKLVRPGGHLIIGLYHRYGRLATDLRRILFRLTGDRFSFLDPRLRGRKPDEAKFRAWFADQYLHPHELKYTIGQVLDWLEPNELKLVKTIPKTTLSGRFMPDEDLFEAEPCGSRLERTICELSQALTGDREGGFFTVISQKTQ
jgi:SAM-dependent methyltransferase